MKGEHSTKPSDLYGRPWVRREYIIVLHHYFLHRGECHDKTAPYVCDIAATLGRTPAAVAMRLYNFASLDPDINKKRSGLQNIGPLGRDVFYYWHTKIETLHIVGAEYELEADAANTPDLFNPEPIRMPLAFGKYEPLDAIGGGGFGTVVSCINPDNGNHYAIKIIRSDLVEDVEALSRFRREISVLKAIEHPNVIAIHDDNLEKERHFPAYVMDLGEWSLRLYLDRYRERFPSADKRPLLPPQEAQSIILQVLAGVEAVHRSEPPIAHRDIKPENILKLSNGEWVIADFGLAKFLPSIALSNSYATASKRSMGSPGYAAPEQFMDFRSAGQQADIYSIGVLIWELFSPAWGSLDRADTDLPDGLHHVVLKCTDKRPEGRYATIEALRGAFLASLPNS